MTDKLTISQIERRLNGKMNRSAIQRFHERVGPLLGAEGTEYPEESLDLWEAIAEARADDKINLRPESAAAWLEMLKIERSRQKPAAVGELFDNRQSVIGVRKPVASPIDAIASVVTEGRFDRFIDALETIAGGTQKATDPMLTADQAREEFGISLSALGKIPSVIDGRRKKWFRSMIIEYLENVRLSLIGNRTNAE